MATEDEILKKRKRLANLINFGDENASDNSAEVDATDVYSPMSRLDYLISNEKDDTSDNQDSSNNTQTTIDTSTSVVSSTPTSNTTPQTPTTTVQTPTSVKLPRGGSYIRNHDRNYDYYKVGNKLYTKKKGTTDWSDISDNSTAQSRINNYLKGGSQKPKGSGSKQSATQSGKTGGTSTPPVEKKATPSSSSTPAAKTTTASKNPKTVTKADKKVETTAATSAKLPTTLSSISSTAPSNVQTAADQRRAQTLGRSKQSSSKPVVTPKSTPVVSTSANYTFNGFNNNNIPDISNLNSYTRSFTQSVKENKTKYAQKSSRRNAFEELERITRPIRNVKKK